MLTGIISGLIIVVVIVAGFWAYHVIKEEKPGTIAADYKPYRAVLSGTQVCLPQKDITSPQTEECAIGLAANDGQNYVLDFNLIPKTYGIIPNGAHISASGVVTPIENLNTDHWQKYNVKGIFSITDSLVVSTTTATTSKPLSSNPGSSKSGQTGTSKSTKPATGGKESATGPCYVGGCSGEVCSGQPNTISNCLYSEQFACYQKATCERQSTGVCGWTPTPELNACLNSK